MALRSLPVPFVSTRSMAAPLTPVGEVASIRFAASPGAPALKPLLLVPLGASLGVKGPAVATIEATLLAPLAVMLVCQVVLLVPLFPVFIDQLAGGAVPPEPIELKSSVNP